jgi:hypothetical protein
MNLQIYMIKLNFHTKRVKKTEATYSRLYIPEAGKEDYSPT